MEKFKINTNNSVLLVIDAQKNLAKAMKKEVYETIEKNINLLISSCKTLQIPIIETEQYAKGLGQTVEAVRDNLGGYYKPIEKMSFSCWNEPSFQEIFKQVNKKHVVVAGIETHVCVLQTALDLVSNNYYVHVVSDAVCSRYKSDWKAALNYLNNCGSVITTTEIVVFQLLQKAGTAEFKAISTLFKNK